jgi:hypothetical protein
MPRFAHRRHVSPAADPFRPQSRFNVFRACRLSLGHDRKAAGAYRSFGSLISQPVHWTADPI